MRRFVIEGADDLVEVGQHAVLHLGEALLAAGLGGVDDLQNLFTWLRRNMRFAERSLSIAGVVKEQAGQKIGRSGK
ncbi:hypothetical protein OG563_38545 [Nocardia vinacea]|uniref:Uncharacterized protein n=1 Tax=Nocardia vinacea TaxID=96468 RepID=A0ABZ1YNY0_9NOCA|nr:hypothetical protein [Nocardia vinacea]